MPHDQMCLKIKMPLNFRKVTSHICCLLRNANSKEGWHLRIKIKFLCRKFVKTHIGNGNKFYQKFHI